MSIMRLYHGSDRILSKPQKQLGKPNNDYGQGFYLSSEPQLAGEWACMKGKDGFVSEYGLETSDLRILRLEKPYHILHWLTLLLKHRRFDMKSPLMVQAKEHLLSRYSIPTEDYDVIIGYRADDSYFSFAEDFLSNQITLEQLSQAMTLGKLGHQVFVQSERAFASLTYLSAIQVEAKLHYYSFRARDEAARNRYLERRRTSVTEGRYMIDLLRKDGADRDIRIPEIVFE